MEVMAMVARKPTHGTPRERYVVAVVVVVVVVVVVTQRERYEDAMGNVNPRGGVERGYLT
jgi:hypothetical protein